MCVSKLQLDFLLLAIPAQRSHSDSVHNHSECLIIALISLSERHLSLKSLESLPNCLPGPEFGGMLALHPLSVFQVDPGSHSRPLRSSSRFPSMARFLSIHSPPSFFQQRVLSSPQPHKAPPPDPRFPPSYPAEVWPPLNKITPNLIRLP